MTSLETKVGVNMTIRLQKHDNEIQQQTSCLLCKRIGFVNNLTITTHFGRAGVEISWELRSRIRGFIVFDGNQIANFETKTTSLI